MSDLIYVLDNLVDKDGKLVIPGIYDDVAVLTTSEAKLYEAIGELLRCCECSWSVISCELEL